MITKKQAVRQTGSGSVLEYAQSLVDRKNPDPRRSVALSFPFYNSLFAALRFEANRGSFLKDVLRHYASLAAVVAEDLRFSIDHRSWGGFVADAWNHYQQRQILESKRALSIEQHPAWPLSDSVGTLLASTLILGTGSKELRDVLAQPHDTGAWFEDVVADELSNMGIPILARNVDVPSGEIDLICFDSLRHFVLEEKDYGPRGKAGYFSSAEYVRRLEEIELYLAKFRKRIDWIRNNGKALGLPIGAYVQALFVMSTDEPDLEMPPDVQLINLRRLCGYFGGSEPVDPLLEYAALRSKGSGKGTSVRAAEPRKASGSGPTEEQMRRIFALIKQKFGSGQAHQVYKVIWEVTKALDIGGVSVTEMVALPYGRPKEATRQYVTFIAHRLDHLSLTEVDEAIEKLTARGWILESQGVLNLQRDLKEEFYKFYGPRLRRVQKREFADVALFIETGKPDGEDRVVGMADGIWSPNRKPVMLMMKEVS